MFVDALSLLLQLAYSCFESRPVCRARPGVRRLPRPPRTGATSRIHSRSKASTASQQRLRESAGDRGPPAAFRRRERCSPAREIAQLYAITTAFLGLPARDSAEFHFASGFVTSAVVFRPLLPARRSRLPQWLSASWLLCQQRQPALGRRRVTPAPPGRSRRRRRSDRPGRPAVCRPRPRFAS